MAQVLKKHIKDGYTIIFFFILKELTFKVYKLNSH